jgi:hypothetical protein
MEHSATEHLNKYLKYSATGDKWHVIEFNEETEDLYYSKEEVVIQLHGDKQQSKLSVVPVKSKNVKF